MRIHEARTLTNQQLAEELDKAHRELMNLRFRDAANQLTDSNRPRFVRKDIARILTVLRERQLRGD